MAHFAQLDTNNIVTTVIVVHNNELLDKDGNQIEQKGIDFCKTLFGQDTKWVQTSYNGNFRKNYAGIGFIYDAINDVFYSSQPFPSWILNNITWLWEAPISRPNDGKLYLWNEDILNWVEIFKE